ncbi:MAG TPA: multicopper oxidase domain-containing protein [Candidatus Elarobacter sp.]|nr:multicopper oxidase domain-containing protein [Candidatus Elarobacter sp.]
MSRRFLALAALIAVPAAAAAVALSGSPRAVAQSAPQPVSRALSAPAPAFAAVPRHPTGAQPTILGATQSNSAGCRPGPERITQTASGRTVQLDVHLTTVHAQINNPSDPAKPVDNLVVRSYDNCLTSPMIEAHPGDSLRILLHNDLSTNDPTCNNNPNGLYLQLPPGAGCFNTTNLHFHGLHVSPSGNSDNVLLSVAPQTTQPYKVDIPFDHPAGTFWYHAHMHGSTAVHVASAVAGPLIIHGSRAYPSRNADIDTVLHDVHGVPFTDTAFLFQQIAYGCFWSLNPSQPYDALLTKAGLYTTNQATGNNNVTPGPAASAPWTCDTAQVSSPLPSPSGSPALTAGVVENFNSQLFSPTIWDTNGRFTSINGVVQPTLTVRAGEIQRWRFIHAGIHDTINVQIVESLPQATASGGARPLVSLLRGKSRLQQAPIVLQSCNANAKTLVPQFGFALDGLTRTNVHTIDPPGVTPLPIPLRALRSTKPTALALPPPVPQYESNYLQPGYRSDILVVFPHPGTYCLLDQSAPPAERVNNGGGGGNGPSVPQLLAYVTVVAGHTVTGNLADYVGNALYGANPQLPHGVREGLRHGVLRPWAPFTELAPPPAGPHHTYAHFQINDSNGAFTVNGNSYDPNTVQGVLIRQVETTDDWDVKVQPQLVFPPAPTPGPNGPTASPTPSLDTGEPHIFHIHVNPFEVVDIYRNYYDQHTGKLLKHVSIYDKNGKCKPEIVMSDPDQLANQYCGMYHVFRDTLFIENNYDVKLRTYYSRYTGEYVLHCHILDHEDAGMMANVLIVEKLGRGPNIAPRMTSMHHH